MICVFVLLYFSQVGQIRLASQVSQLVRFMFLFLYLQIRQVMQGRQVSLHSHDLCFCFVKFWSGRLGKLGKLGKLGRLADMIRVFVSVCLVIQVMQVRQVSLYDLCFCFVMFWSGSSCKLCMLVETICIFVLVCSDLIGYVGQVGQLIRSVFLFCYILVRQVM